MAQRVETTLARCSAEGCEETAITSVESKALCRRHFLANAYRHLESISAQILEPRFHENHGEAAGRFLEECMRRAADIACAPAPPSNLERAQVLDVLLWASELHGRLRRGPRVKARIPIQLRSEEPPWEENAETQLLSRHGFQLTTQRELNVEDRVVCTRLDNNWKAESRVVWVRRTESGKTEAGFEFLSDDNFWGISTWPVMQGERRR